ncbi:MAG: hypothetical protein KBF98_02055 [Rhodoferax sp.]|jgi:hypothetical protein|nr:hypothetical protein [Rhodoferax sp.]MBP9059079.1 hypothetical protein [Rhodoferax sp.]MBP9685107.1 hypothetical protein [Rhodoferax sp.]
MQFNLENIEIDPDAARQYIDARSAFTELERTQKNALQVRGGMVWKTVDDKEYLIRTSPTGAQKGLGRRSAETEAIYQSFKEKKQAMDERVSSLKTRVAKHKRMNRALRVGRMPNIALAILNRLANAGLDTYFRVVGTHALYAYEAAGGVSFSSEITSTRDIDLLWDTRKRVVFSQRLAQDSPSMLAALQKVDKTFQIIEDQKYTAINKDGFEVDIIRRFAPEGDPHPIRLSDALDDFWVVQAKRAGDLANAPEFSEIVVAEGGAMARMTTIHPAVFVSFKRWMSKEPDRDPLKRRRDALQADAVEWLLHERLPHLLT